MSEKMTKCKTCQADVATSAKVCPHCGAKNKKSVAKKWWFWLIIVFVFGIFVLGSDSGSVQTSTESTSASTTEKSNSAQNDKEEEKTTTQEANSSVELSPAQTYSTLSEFASTPFTVSDKATSFINEHKNFFPGDSNIRGAISDFVDYDITYQHLTKNISKYGDKLVCVYGNVIDIEEDEELPLTYIHLLDYYNNSYILYYLGVLDNVFEGTEIMTYALPLDLITFENMQAQYTEAVVCAAAYVEAQVI